MDNTASLSAARNAFLDAKRVLAEEIASARRNGTPVQAIADEVAPALTAGQLAAYVQRCAVYEAAVQALAQSGLRDAVILSAPDLPSQDDARLKLVTVDPNEYQDCDLLARDVRELLTESGISLAPSQGSADQDAESVLLSGESVRLIQND
jgi:hypothetical protein